jgi:hypothetical protein
MQSNWTAPSLMNGSIQLCLQSGSVQPVIPKLGTRCGVSGQFPALACNPLNTRVCGPTAILDVENR